MQVQEKNIKGFNLLELIVVMVIVGIVSAVAYPNFSDWRKEREVRQGVAKIQSLIKNIYTQTERGTFAFVQVLINPTDTHIFIESKGMTMQTLASKINNGSDVWNNPNDDNPRCNIEDTNYWDTDTAAAGSDISNAVYSLNLPDVTTNLTAMTAVCFSRNGKFYESVEELKSTVGVVNFMYICRRDFDGDVCAIEMPYKTVGNKVVRVSPRGGEVNEDFYRTVNWTRFGNVTTSKLRNEYDDKGEFTGGTWLDIPSD